MEEILQLIMKSYGLLGVIILAPFVAVWLLWKDNKVLQKQLGEAQQMRVKDAQEISHALILNASENASLLKENNLLLERMSEALERIERN